MRQKNAVKRMAENGGVASTAMVDVGYSEQTAKTPHKLTKSKGFKEILAEAGITDEYLSKKHKKLLESRKEEIVTKNLDLAYKVKGHFAPEIVNTTVTLVSRGTVIERLKNLKDKV